MKRGNNFLIILLPSQLRCVFKGLGPYNMYNCQATIIIFVLTLSLLRFSTDDKNFRLVYRKAFVNDEYNVAPIVGLSFKGSLKNILGNQRKFN